MKKSYLFLVFVTLFFGCSDDDNDPVVAVQQTEDLVEVIAKGNFISGAHPTSGVASVNGAKTILTFTDFKTDTGPKLLVYLTTEVGSNDYVSLGELKGVSGNYTYDVPANTDIKKYKIVDIWCVDFSVSFGHAELK